MITLHSARLATLLAVLVLVIAAGGTARAQSGFGIDIDAEVTAPSYEYDWFSDDSTTGPVGGTLLVASGGTTAELTATPSGPLQPSWEGFGNSYLSENNSVPYGGSNSTIADDYGGKTVSRPGFDAGGPMPQYVIDRVVVTCSWEESGTISAGPSGQWGFQWNTSGTDFLWIYVQPTGDVWIDRPGTENDEALYLDPDSDSFTEVFYLKDAGIDIEDDGDISMYYNAIGGGSTHNNVPNTTASGSAEFSWHVEYPEVGLDVNDL